MKEIKEFIKRVGVIMWK